MKGIWPLWRNSWSYLLYQLPRSSEITEKSQKAKIKRMECKTWPKKYCRLIWNQLKNTIFCQRKKIEPFYTIEVTQSPWQQMSHLNKSSWDTRHYCSWCVADWNDTVMRLWREWNGAEKLQVKTWVSPRACTQDLLWVSHVFRFTLHELFITIFSHT